MSEPELGNNSSNNRRNKSRDIQSSKDEFIQEVKIQQYSNYLEATNQPKIKIKKDKKMEFDSADAFLKNEENLKQTRRSREEQEQIFQLQEKNNKNMKKKFPLMKKREDFDSGTYFIELEEGKKKLEKMQKESEKKLAAFD